MAKLHLNYMKKSDEPQSDKKYKPDLKIHKGTDRGEKNLFVPTNKSNISGSISALLLLFFLEVEIVHRQYHKMHVLVTHWDCWVRLFLVVQFHWGWGSGRGRADNIVHWQPPKQQVINLPRAEGGGLRDTAVEQFSCNTARARQPVPGRTEERLLGMGNSGLRLPLWVVSSEKSFIGKYLNTFIIKFMW